MRTFGVAALLWLSVSIAIVTAKKDSKEVEAKKILPRGCGSIEQQPSGEGELMSHNNYGRCTYKKNSKCEWDLTADAKDVRSRLSFSFMDYEMPRQEQPCTNSYIKFYNGTDTSQAPFISICSGRDLPKPFNSTGVHTHVVFQANDFEAKGFKVKWTRFRECINKEGFDIKCDDGTCLENKWRLRCNAKKDCKDGSDEKNCEEAVCKANEVHCKHKFRCYDPKKEYCNGFDFCGDNSDEAGCDIKKCDAKTEWRCDHKYACIKRKSLCDGKEDCNDGSDEKHCSKPGDCPSAQHQCRFSKSGCLDKAKLCNTVNDCADASDEENCPYKQKLPNGISGVIPPCQLNQMLCQSSKNCIGASLACNGKSDCGAGDNSDEENCDLKKLCPTNKWHVCTNNQYILGTQKCDKKPQCADGSDEKGCGPAPAPPAPPASG